MNKENVKNIILKGIDLIGKGWTQKELARDQFGKGVPIESLNACFFCLSGGLHRAALDLKLPYADFNTAREIVIENIHNEWIGIVSFNDYIKTTKEDVLNVLQKCLDEVERL